MSPSHCETALQRIQRIVTTASKADAPITQREAYEQIVEELELAGYGATCLDERLADEAARSALH